MALRLIFEHYKSEFHEALSRKAVDFDETVAICPSCREPAVQLEIRHSFRMKELIQRFRSEPVPAKYALADMYGGTVCFDLEEDYLNG